MAAGSLLQRLRTCGPGFLLVALIAPLLATITGSADAAPAPYAEQGWGVYNSVVGGTLTEAIDNEVMAIEQIGNRIFVGGKFTEVRQFNTATPVSRRFLAAFDATTGAYISSFTPDLSGPVYALQKSPDGQRLFVGGEFADVAGVTNTKALVALDPNSGAVDTSFIPSISRNGRAVVYSLDQAGSHLYVGGAFDAVQTTTRFNTAKLSLSNAALDSTWRPRVTGGPVWGIAVAPNRSKVYLAGYFTEVNGVDGTEGFVPVSNNSGSVQPGRVPHNNIDRRYYLDVEAVNDLVFVAGSEHIMWVMDANSTEIVRTHSTGGFGADFGNGGDYQDLEVVGDRVYAGCHCRGNHYADGDIFQIDQGNGGTFSREDPIKFVAAYSATTGAYIPSFLLDVSGSSGVWAIHGASDGCLWVGGDLTRATREDGTNQARGGFTRHCDGPEGGPGDGGGDDGGGDNGGGDDGDPGDGGDPAEDTERPTKPSGVEVDVDGSDVTISWNASSDNVGVTGYEVRRANSDGGPASLVGTPSSTSFTDENLDPGTYWYYIRALDEAGNDSSRTGYKSATVTNDAGPGDGGGDDGDPGDGGDPAEDTERPTKPSGVEVDVDGSDVTISWNASSDNVGVTGYEVRRANSDGGPASLVGTPSSTSFTDENLDPGTYWYYIRALDEAGNDSSRTGYKSATVTNDAGPGDGGGDDGDDGDDDGGPADGDTERPDKPTGLETSASGSRATLTWNAATDNVGVTGYEVYRSTSDGGVASKIGTSSNTTYNDSGLNNGTYWYYLKAYDAAGNLSWRNGYTSVTISDGGGGEADTERPSTPTGLTLNSNNSTSASFSWTASTDNVQVTGYRIYNGDGSIRATTSAGTNFVVSGLSPNTSYPMYVKAYDAAGNESWRSNIRTFTTD